jgi:hypothetical protein
MSLLSEEIRQPVVLLMEFGGGAARILGLLHRGASSKDNRPRSERRRRQATAQTCDRARTSCKIGDLMEEGNERETTYDGHDVGEPHVFP